MKTPEETRRSLEHCATAIECKGCAYKGEVDCHFRLIDDANGLVQQLEAERDAALDPIRGDCAYCAYLSGETIPDTCFDCANKGYYRWEFRNKQKEG